MRMAKKPSFKWNLHYAVVCNGEIVCEDSSFDWTIDWAMSHEDDYPNNKVYAVWDLTKPSEFKGMNGDVVNSHKVECEALDFDFKKHEETFLKVIKLCYGVELTKDDEEVFLNSWH